MAGTGPVAGPRPAALPASFYTTWDLFNLHANQHVARGRGLRVRDELVVDFETAQTMTGRWRSGAGKSLHQVWSNLPREPKRFNVVHEVKPEPAMPEHKKCERKMWERFQGSYGCKR